MRDNDIIRLLIAGIVAGESVAGVTGTAIKQSFQPTQQGANVQPTAYMIPVSHARLGSPYRADVWDEDLTKIIHTEIQQYATTFQISTLATQNPATPNALTAADILNSIAYIMQADNFIQYLQDNNLGIQRIMQIRNPYFENDKGRHEASPSMDFIITHKQIVLSESPVVQSVEFNMQSV